MSPKLFDSLINHQIEGKGISGLALPVNLLSSSNEFLTYPCSGVLEILEHGADLSIVVAVFHRLNKDWTLDAPVEVKNIEFMYDVSIVR